MEWRARGVEATYPKLLFKKELSRRTVAKNVLKKEGYAEVECMHLQEYERKYLVLRMEFVKSVALMQTVNSALFRIYNAII
mmetsp:Transcript_28592/g.42268  ORF Transcript_28592/g.42268 Transcript_28592/m.42268 type:complete len:81 (-) Transcript_28592:1584-1826(-)